MSAITQSAAGQSCTIRVPGICEFHHAVLCHYRMAGTAGAGEKPPDMQGAYGCTPCHDEVDGRMHRSAFSRADLRLMHAEGVMRTQLLLLRQGLITIAADARPPKLSFQGVPITWDEPGDPRMNPVRARWINELGCCVQVFHLAAADAEKSHPNDTPEQHAARCARYQAAITRLLDHVEPALDLLTASQRIGP